MLQKQTMYFSGDVNANMVVHRFKHAYSKYNLDILVVDSAHKGCQSFYLKISPFQIRNLYVIISLCKYKKVPETLH